MLKKVVTKFREKVILKTSNNHQANKTIYKRWERGKTAIFLEVPLRGDLRFTLSKLSVSLNAQISETLVMKLENMIYLHLVHHYHFQIFPGIFWFQAQDVQPQWVPQWTRDMQKPGAIPLFSILFCKNLVRFSCFFCKNLIRFYCFVCCKNLVRRLYCFQFHLSKTWCDSIVFSCWKPGGVLLLLFLGVQQNMLSLNESKHSFYPAGNSCEKLRKTCLESPRPRFLRSSPYYWLWEFRTTRWIWWRRPRWRKRRK